MPKVAQGGCKDTKTVSKDTNMVTKGAKIEPKSWTMEAKSTKNKTPMGGLPLRYIHIYIYIFGPSSATLLSLTSVIKRSSKCLHPIKRKSVNLYPCSGTRSRGDVLDEGFEELPAASCARSERIRATDATAEVWHASPCFDLGLSAVRGQRDLLTTPGAP